MKPGILGPPGTFSEAAAARYWPQVSQFVRAESLPDLLQMLKEKAVSDILIPFENSCSGILRNSLEGLTMGPVSIQGEVVVAVEQHLMSRAQYRLEDIELLISQPVALTQCEKYIRSRLPGVRIEMADSTARAAEMAAREIRPAAAIGHRQAARNYGLTVIASGIQQENNYTRFLHLSAEPGREASGNKSSLIFELEDKPGALYQALEVFAGQDLNLSKIESYPVKAKRDYRFYVEVDLPSADKLDTRVLEELKNKCRMVTYLGSYYRYMEESHEDTSFFSTASALRSGT